MNCTTLDENTWKDVLTILEEHLAQRGKVNGKKAFIEDVLYLLNNKLENGNMSQLRFSTLPRKCINPRNHSKRFERWRNAGIWEHIISLLIQKRKYQWLAKPAVYSCLCTNYRLLLNLNKINKIDEELQRERLLESVREEYRQQQEKVLNEISIKHNAELKNLKNEFEKQTENKKYWHEVEIKKLNLKKEEEIERLNQEHQAYIDDLKEYKECLRLKKIISDLKADIKDYKKACASQKAVNTELKNQSEYGMNYIRQAIAHYRSCTRK